MGRSLNAAFSMTAGRVLAIHHLTACITETFEHTDTLLTLYAMLLCVPRCVTVDLGAHKSPTHLLYLTSLCSKVSKRLE